MLSEKFYLFIFLFIITFLVTLYNYRNEFKKTKEKYIKCESKLGKIELICLDIIPFSLIFAFIGFIIFILYTIFSCLTLTEVDKYIDIDKVYNQYSYYVKIENNSIVVDNDYFNTTKISEEPTFNNNLSIKFDNKNIIFDDYSFRSINKLFVNDEIDNPIFNVYTTTFVDNRWNYVFPMFKEIYITELVMNSEDFNEFFK